MVFKSHKRDNMLCEEQHLKAAVMKAECYPYVGVLTKIILALRHLNLHVGLALPSERFKCSAMH